VDNAEVDMAVDLTKQVIGMNKLINTDELHGRLDLGASI
jgi:hypothetical protein